MSQPRSAGMSISTIVADRIRALTTPSVSSLLQPAAIPLGRLTRHAPLIDAEILFRQPGPARLTRGVNDMSNESGELADGA